MIATEPETTISDAQKLEFVYNEYISRHLFFVKEYNLINDSDAVTRMLCRVGHAFFDEIGFNKELFVKCITKHITPNRFK